jgi:GntR family transcriptional repressor for pyruvate dehydrogenase complex
MLPLHCGHFIISSYQLLTKDARLENSYTPVQANRVFEQIAEQIERRILSGEIQVGDRLPTERELAEQFHASRTAVREAMKSLAQKGLVDMRPGRGTIVIDGTSRAMRNSLELMMQLGLVRRSENLVEVREILEPEIAALAAARATEEQIAMLRECVAQMDASLGDADAFIAADNAFHQTLATSTHNEIIRWLVDSIVSLLSEQRKHIFAVSGGPERGQVHHKLLLEAVIRHDPAAARQAMQAHLRQVREDVATSLEKNADS